MAWTLYSEDGFQEVATFTTGSSMQRWLDSHPGLYVVDHGDGRMRSVGSKATRSQRQTDYERLFSAPPPRPRRTAVSGNWMTAAAFPAKNDRRGTGHTHPPGRTRCPKCGV